MTAEQYEARIADLTAALQTAADFIDRYADVESDGYPNAALSITSYINRVLEN